MCTLNLNVEELIIKCLNELKRISSEGEIIKDQKSKIIFPKYYVGEHALNDNTKKRISEQEARFLLTREIELGENTDYYYSIETPTKNRYTGFANKDENPVILNHDDSAGRSASVDLSLYIYDKENDDFIRKHLIEFKQGNPKTCKKDFLKLIFDEKGLANYYINIIERDERYKGRTIDSLKRKYNKAIEELKKENIKLQYSSILKIYLFNINDGELITSNKIDINNNTNIISYDIQKL